MLKNIVVLPALNNQYELNDFLTRTSWHLSIIKNLHLTIYITDNNLSFDNFTIPDGFHKPNNEGIYDFLSCIDLVVVDNSGYLKKNLISNATAILKLKESNDELDYFLKKYSSSPIYRVDPDKVRQEGSFYIQCAFDLIENKNYLINQLKIKFSKFSKELGKFSSAWVLATGPSVEKFINYDYDSSLVIACNSTILDNKLVEHCQPKILVFADPIFHFGVSEYAGKFREIVKKRLSESNITIIVPIKYYSLLISKFPEYESRIIAIPFSNEIDFNFDLENSFLVKTTSNILTLLLLPVASHFSDNINILGCDGRSLDDDSYFWGHGKSVQINDKMANIKKVHPGFFNIDYNEYYFEHCHTLDNLLLAGERKGKKYIHRASSYIPTFQSRCSHLRPKKSFMQDSCVILEPDGVGLDGHYVGWHNQLIEQLKNEGYSPLVFCSKKQDPSLYNCATTRVFTSHSWGISRADWCYHHNFYENNSFQRFFSELEDALNFNELSVTIFIYYGSAQILYGLHQLRKKMKAKNIKITISICLFHESAILNKNYLTPRFPSQAKTIIMEAVSQPESYVVSSVTNKLSNYIYDKFDIRIGTMPNPIPCDFLEDISIPNDNLNKNQLDCARIILPCLPRYEKGECLTKELFSALKQEKISNDEFKFRPLGMVVGDVNNVSFLDSNMSDIQYQKCLIESDIIIIPYLAPYFTYRTSGIIVDAMRAKKPIIVISNTWLSEIIRKYKFGLEISPRSYLSIISAINVIKKNYKFFKLNAELSYLKYSKENNWKKLVHIMFRY